MDTMKAFVFDVDGTLTPSREVMNPIHKEFFLQFAKENDMYIVTGSDKNKTIEQVGEDVWNLAKRAYQCSGNDVWEESEQVWLNEWELDEEPLAWLAEQLTASNFSPKTGKHFDIRPGLLNFSIVGRNATTEQRADYVAYEKDHSERIAIAQEFNEKFAELEVIAVVAGETGIDITEVGCGKDQIIDDFDGYDEVVFFGDRTLAGGNDHGIAKALIDQGHTVFAVTNPTDTFEILQNMYAVSNG